MPPSAAATTLTGPLSGTFAAADRFAAGAFGGQAAVSGLPPALQDHVLSLGQHLRQCQQAQGRWFGLGRLGHELHAWVAPRFVTTLAGASVLIALACLF